MTKIPLKTEGSLFTDTQWQAIHQSGSNLLISASAGSGKTLVLVHRILEKIKQGVGIDELLVVTFTNAAAKEMKQRIQRLLQEDISAEPEYKIRNHLTQQLPKLGHADISTLHSFCLKVIERYYYLIDFDPVFRMLTDDTEIELIKEDVWDELLEELYEEADADFIHLMEAYAGNRDDEQITEMVFALHEFARANTEPTKWLQNLPETYQVNPENLGESKIYQNYFKNQLLDEIELSIDLIEQALSLANDDEHLEKQIKIMREDMSQYEQVSQLLEEDKLNEAYEFIQEGYKFPSFRQPTKSVTPDEIMELHINHIYPLRDEAKKVYTKFIEHFVLSPQEQGKIIQKMQTHIKVLSEITRRFAESYQAYKMERKFVDFNDLEHRTLEILTDKNEEGVSEAAQYYQNKFEEVLVDEYQDINALQEEILLRVSRAEREEGNYFMVGDVKQSIYGFRLADPSLFLSKYEQYAENEKGQRIILAENFRSRAQILSFINFVFMQLMDQKVGNLTYDENAALQYGNRDFKFDESFKTELLLYKKGDNKKERFDELTEAEELLAIETKTQGEILTVAARIKELMARGFEIYDKDEERMRPLEYRDIVLLTPTKKNNLEIQELFQEANIPTAINETQNFFQTTEVTIIMSLLKIIDNPKQDIPFVAVLRSPIVGLDEVELTYIRLQDQKVGFYEATQAFAADTHKDARSVSVQKKVQAFLENLDQWREFARRKSVVDLLRLLYQETGFIDYVGGMTAGKQRKANLEALYHRAASYEKTSFKGLYRFIRFIDKMQEKEKDLAEPTSILSEQNAIRVMTIHASKGLEFPVVFLMDMSKWFNHSDWTNSYVFDRDLGIGLKYKDPEAQIQTSTLVDTVIRNQKKKAGYAEEMRLLYVALTRAEQKLFLVGSARSKEKAFEKWDRGNASREILLPAQLRLGTNNFMDWIGMSIARHEIAAGDTPSLQENQQVKNYAVHFEYYFYSEEQIADYFHEPAAEEKLNWFADLQKNKLQVDEDVSKAVGKAMNLIHYDYPYQLSTQTTNYQSVSEVKQLFEEPNDGQVAKIDWSDEERISRYAKQSFERPKFLQETTAPTPAEIGQATHLVLQKMDLTEEPTQETIAELLSGLVTEGIIQKEMVSLIAVETILSYFQTSFGQKILKHGRQVKKEVLFSLLMEASELFVGMEELEDSILIHGIIDGYFEQENGLVLFDYKTDRIAHLGKQAEEEMRRRYQGQLRLYKQALESITGKTVVEIVIIALDIGATIYLK